MEAPLGNAQKASLALEPGDLGSATHWLHDPLKVS